MPPTITPAVASQTACPAPKSPALAEMLAAEPDLVDRIFDYLLAAVPALAGDAALLSEAKAAVRDEFGGERVYVRSARDMRRHELARQVLQLFNGRNASEVARKLRIGRTTVYRLLKQPGRSVP